MSPRACFFVGQLNCYVVIFFLVELGGLHEIGMNLIPGRIQIKVVSCLHSLPPISSPFIFDHI